MARFLLKRALIATADDSIHLINELPYFLKKGGYRVTVVSFRHWLVSHCSFIDEFIETSSDSRQVIEQVARLLRERTFDLTILGNDRLIWALLDSEMEPSIKSKLYPIQNLSRLDALSGKVGVAALAKELGILAPPSQAVETREEARAAALEIGFPVMLKVSRSGAGTGVFKCHTLDEVERAPVPQGQTFLVEKFLEGDLVSVEPLFLNSRLAAYSYSLMTYAQNPFEPSLERLFMPHPEIEPLLLKLGKELGMNGFANISLIRDRKTGEHFLFELDFRPNRWIRYGSFVGVDWARALKGPSPLQRPQRTRLLRHFPADLQNAIRTRNGPRILYWLFNRQGCWKTVPLHDLRLLFWGGWRLLRRIALECFNGKRSCGRLKRG